ncbi:MAG: hypothetical protein HY300_02505, partial [Verrucomicrobia bacterium]|nr:hypothetical protein [Verrucomicrobiota bacterium]
MKPLIRICVVAALALLSFAPDARAALALTLGQSSISNYFTGSVSVTVTGLTNGETVILERYVDMNNSGTVDAGDLLVSYLTLTDGVGPVIGGVRNVNVPGDDDGAANGTIQTKISFPDTSNFDHFAGNYVIRVSSPSRGISDTKTFAITATPFAQTVTGTVSGGANCAVALLMTVGQDPTSGLPGVLLLCQGNDNMFTVAYTDTNGNFTASVTASVYKFEMDEQPPTVLGYVRLNNKSFFDATAGNVTGANISLPKANALIFGYVRDAQSNSYSGLSVQANDNANTYSASAFSATNGYFTLGVVGGGNWSLYLDNKQIAPLNLTSGSTNVFVSTAQAVQADVPVQGVTAHLTGRVVDNLNNPLPNFTLVAQISVNGMVMGNSQYPSTDGSGNFDIGVYGG